MLKNSNWPKFSNWSRDRDVALENHYRELERAGNMSEPISNRLRKYFEYPIKVESVETRDFIVFSLDSEVYYYLPGFSS